MTSFEKKVFRALRRIPRGRVTTYAALARAIGRPQAARAVGNALHKNPFAPQLPCHRVVRSDGALGGYAGGPKEKATLLRREGLIIRRGKIDLRKFGIEPVR